MDFAVRRLDAAFPSWTPAKACAARCGSRWWTTLRRGLRGYAAMRT